MRLASPSSGCRNTRKARTASARADCSRFLTFCRPQSNSSSKACRTLDEQVGCSFAGRYERLRLQCRWPKGWSKHSCGLKMPICGAGSWAWCRELPVTENLKREPSADLLQKNRLYF
jgi:hypothetical protein